MIRRCLYASLVLAGFTAHAGQYDKPYALIEAADPSEVRKEFRPAITKIDGVSPRSSVRSDPVEPGNRVVTIRFATGRVTQSPAEETREMQMVLEPCVRYRIAAHRTSGTQWEPKVYTEPIGECAKKFRQPKQEK